MTKALGRESKTLALVSQDRWASVPSSVKSGCVALGEFYKDVGEGGRKAEDRGGLWETIPISLKQRTVYICFLF